MPPSYLSFFVDGFPFLVFWFYVLQIIFVPGIYSLGPVDQVVYILSIPLMIGLSLALAFFIGRARLRSLKKETLLLDRVRYQWEFLLSPVLGLGWLPLTMILLQVIPLDQALLVVFLVLGWVAWGIAFMLLLPLLYILTDEGLWIRSMGIFFFVPFSKILNVQYLPESRVMFPTPLTRPIARWHNYVFIEHAIRRKLAYQILKKYLTPSDPALFLEILSSQMKQHPNENQGEQC